MLTLPIAANRGLEMPNLCVLGADGRHDLLVTRPAISANRHVLPFAQLDPATFERLCLWLAQARGYQRVEHTGAAGSDGGRDVIAWRMRDGREEFVYFQCKHARVSPRAHLLRADVDKILGAAAAGHFVKPAVLVFMTTTNLSARLRDGLRERCGQHGVEVEFLAATELDHEIKQHPALVREFFGVMPEGR